MADESQRNSATSSFVAYGTRAADLSEAAQGVAALIEALAKTARAGRLYAPNNRALANFRDVLLGLFGEYFADHEELTLQVRPDRFLWGPEGEAVYEDGDREHGFPFRLYRDGIRVLTLVVGITDDELMELVRILGQRTIGQLEEEDLATRLWSMRSEHIRYRQVSGFVDATLRPRAGGKDNAEGLVARALAEPVEGLPVPAPLDAPARTPSELQGRWLDEWSFPPIRKRRDDEPIFATLDAGQIQEFHGGLAFDPAVLLCHVIARCVDTGTKATLPAVSPDDLRDLLEDSRDGLVASGDVHAYLRVLLFLHDLRDQVTDPEWRAEVDRVLVQGNTRPTLRLLLAAVGRGDAAPADVLFALRGMAELEPTWLADALAETPDEEGRVAVADAAVDLLWPDEDAVEELLALCNPGSLRAVVTALARVSPDGSMALLRKVFADADAETQVRILTTALTRRDRDGLPRLAKRALASSSDEVLALGLRAAALTRNPKLLQPIEAMIQPGPLMEMNRETAVEALRTYAEMPEGDKLGWLIKQARPPRMALMDSAGEELRCRYALALGLVIDERARKALVALQGKGSAAFQEAVKGALRRSRREFRS